jgi:hypothetical protein
METTPPTEDVYAAQRDELLALLKSLLQRNEPLAVHGRPRLSRDGVAALLQKLRNGHPFSGREREALVEAGFSVEKLYPKL